MAGKVRSTLTRRMRIGGVALLIALGCSVAGCGPSQEEVQREIQQANEAQARAEHAEVAARQAQAAADAATAAANKARKDVDAATAEINRVGDHIEQLNRERDAGED